MAGEIITEQQVNEVLQAEKREEREKYNLSAKNAGAGVTELAPFYILKEVDFNKNTRAATLTIEQHTNYRTITGGGAPVYSGWKTRKKTITKNIKLTDVQLENLIENEDALVAKFAKEIISRLGSDFYPSWFVKDILYTLYKNQAARIDSECAQAADGARQDIYNTNGNISKILTDINGKKAEITLKQAEARELEQKIERTESRFLRTKGSVNKLKESLENTNIAIRNLQAAVENLQKIVENCRDRIERKERIIQLKTAEAEQLKNKAFLDYYETRQKVLPLQETSGEDGFLPLKNFAGREYEPIIGCYILRNTQNKRCYVGQSRDVFKRIRQHFKGTTPNNIIFAEDYYNSDMENKEDMFEYKIIPCEEEDLNRAERELIEKYDAHTYGYNQTAGNSD